MGNKFRKLVGIDFPLVAFSHCRDVVVAVSKAGGFGVLGASSHTPEHLKHELDWIDAHIGGAPYGVDLAIPESMAHKHDKGMTVGDLAAHVPPEYHRFTEQFLMQFDIDPHGPVSIDPKQEMGLMGDTAERLMDIAFEHPIKLVVQALGLPPQSMMERARAKGIPVGALVGSVDHAVRQSEYGVDVLVAQGTEAGGHCGEVSTMVLTPEVVRAVDPAKTSVLAAGGIATGQQMAAAMAMGADGVWTGSVWLTTTESDVSPVVRDKLLAATSRDTVRTKSFSGKSCRQLRSAWTVAWDSGATGLKMLPMPLQPMIAMPMLERATRSAEAGNQKALAAVNYLCGQAIGMIDTVKSARAVVDEFREEYLEAIERMNALLAEDD